MKTINFLIVVLSFLLSCSVGAQDFLTITTGNDPIGNTLPEKRSISDVEGSPYLQENLQLAMYFMMASLHFLKFH